MGVFDWLTGTKRPVGVAGRNEIGSSTAPGLTQWLRIATVVGAVRQDLVQSQVYLPMSDVEDTERRAVVRLVLTATPTQHQHVLADFQEFVRTVLPDEQATR